MEERSKNNTLKTLAAVSFLNIQYSSMKVWYVIRIYDWLSSLTFGAIVPRLYNGHLLTFLSSITLRTTLLSRFFYEEDAFGNLKNLYVDWLRFIN